MPPTIRLKNEKPIKNYVSVLLHIIKNSLIITRMYYSKKDDADITTQQTATKTTGTILFFLLDPVAERVLTLSVQSIENKAQLTYNKKLTHAQCIHKNIELCRKKAR